MELDCFYSREKFDSLKHTFKDYKIIKAVDINLSSFSYFSECNGLEKLDIRFNYITEINIESIYPFLTDFYTHGFTMITSFKGLENLPNLRRFSMTYHPKSTNIIKLLYNRGVEVELYFLRGESKIISTKLNLYKIKNMAWTNIFKHYKRRIKKSVSEIIKLTIKNKILDTWLSFFEQKKDRFGYNRLSYFLEIISKELFYQKCNIPAKIKMKFL